jgi:hypothetical protein
LKSKATPPDGHALAQVVEQEVAALGLGLVVAEGLGAAHRLEDPLAELRLAVPR